LSAINGIGWRGGTVVQTLAESSNLKDERGELVIRKLIAYRVHPIGQRIVPGQSRRQWMDETRHRFAYRCLPLTIANSMGWEILLPAKVRAEWNGGPNLSDLTIESDDPVWKAKQLAMSHFGHGVLTFPINYLFRTEPGIGLWARGAPNSPKDGIAPLDGLIETDWLSFTFTMNWQFTRPGCVTFEKDEPFCFITPIAYRSLVELTPEIIPIADVPEVAEQFKAYAEARKNFNDKLMDNDPVVARQGWQKWYMRGESPSDGASNPLHISNLKLAEPIERSGLFGASNSKKI
jgi:hypothetical protein